MGHRYMLEDRDGDGVPEEYPIEHGDGEANRTAHKPYPSIREFFGNSKQIKKWREMNPKKFKLMPPISEDEYQKRVEDFKPAQE